MLIRNVKNKMDLAKKLREQKENLRIEIANDNNIATARKNVRFGIVPPPVEGQQASQAEVANDENSIMSRARDNLLTMFNPDKVRNILITLSVDKMRFLNIYWNDFKQRLERIDRGLIDVSVFNSMYDKYISDTLAQKGLGQQSAINEPTELQDVVPNRKLIQLFYERVDKTNTPGADEIGRELRKFQDFVPNKSIVDKLEDLSPSDQEAFVSRLIQVYTNISPVVEWQRVLNIRNQNKFLEEVPNLYSNFTPIQQDIVNDLFLEIKRDEPTEILLDEFEEQVSPLTEPTMSRATSEAQDAMALMTRALSRESVSKSRQSSTEDILNQATERARRRSFTTGSVTGNDPALIPRRPSLSSVLETPVSIPVAKAPPRSRYADAPAADADAPIKKGEPKAFGRKEEAAKARPAPVRSPKAKPPPPPPPPKYQKKELKPPKEYDEKKYENFLKLKKDRQNDLIDTFIDEQDLSSLEKAFQVVKSDGSKITKAQYEEDSVIDIQQNMIDELKNSGIDSDVRKNFVKKYATELDNYLEKEIQEVRTKSSKSQKSKAQKEVAVEAVEAAAAARKAAADKEFIAKMKGEAKKAEFYEKKAEKAVKEDPKSQEKQKVLREAKLKTNKALYDYLNLQDTANPQSIIELTKFVKDKVYDKLKGVRIAERVNVYNNEIKDQYSKLLIEQFIIEMWNTEEDIDEDQMRYLDLLKGLPGQTKFNLPLYFPTGMLDDFKDKIYSKYDERIYKEPKPEKPKQVPARSPSLTERASSTGRSAFKGTANLLGLRTKGASKTEPEERKEASKKGVASFMSKTQKGDGIKRGRGMRTITDKVLEPISRWIQVGKLKYNNRLLDEKQMFSVKYPSGAVNPHFAKNVAVSDLFYELMKNLEKSQKVDTRILKELDPDEKKLFENFIVRSGTGRQFNIMDVSPTDEEAEKEKRMTIVKGSYLAGNNSPEVINELRSLILYFIGINRIDKKQGLATLQSIV